MGVYQKESRVNYHNTWRNFLNAIVILSFGASLGPEAALFSIVAGLATLVGDKLRYFYCHHDEKDQKNIFAFLIQSLLSKNATQAYQIDKAPTEKKQHQKKVFLYGLIILTGLTWFFYLQKHNNSEQFFTLLGQSQWSWNWLLLFFPLILVGKLFGYCYKLFDQVITFLLANIRHHIVLLAVIGGLVLGIVGWLIPFSLFSGEAAFKEISNYAASASLWTLLLIAFGKLFITKFCLKTGWRGGHIFPILFASVVFGFFIAKLLPIYDTLFIVSIITAASGVQILKQPLLIAIILPFFPMQTWFFILLASYVTVGKLPFKKSSQDKN